MRKMSTTEQAASRIFEAKKKHNKMKSNMKIKAEAGQAGMLEIFGHIGPDWWAEDPEENTAKRINEKLEALKECESVTVRINSLGGDVDTALAVYALLKECKNVTTEAVGMVASAATIIFMAGSTRKMNKGALFLVHKCSSSVYWGNENELEKTLEMQRTVNETMTDIYTGGGVSRETVEELMEANHGEGKWITAKETKQYGFATEVSEGTRADAEARRVWSAEDLAEEGLPMTGGVAARLRELFRGWLREENANNNNNQKSNEMKETQTPAQEEATPTVQEEQTGAEAGQSSQAEEPETARAERDRLRAEVAEKTAENQQLRARVAKLEAVVAASPEGAEQPNGDDAQAGEGEEKFADWLKRQSYHAEVEAELKRRRTLNN